MTNFSSARWSHHPKNINMISEFAMKIFRYLILKKNSITPFNSDTNKLQGIRGTPKSAQMRLEEHSCLDIYVERLW